MVLGNTLAALSLLSGQSIEYRWLAIILGLLAKNGPLMSAGVFFFYFVSARNMRKATQSPLLHLHVQPLHLVIRSD